MFVVVSVVNKDAKRSLISSTSETRAIEGGVQ